MREWRFYMPAGVVGALVAGIVAVATAAGAGGATSAHRPLVTPANVAQLTKAWSFTPRPVNGPAGLLSSPTGYHGVIHTGTPQGPTGLRAYPAGG